MDPTTKAPKSINLRMPAAQLALLKDEHARTYSTHRMSFNAWLISRIFALQPRAAKKEASK